MQTQLLDMGGHGREVVFAHANGYPPQSYRVLAHSLATVARVRALEHRPLWDESEPPSTVRWSVFADDMLTVLRRECSEPVWVMGHSMGGTTAVLAASREPERFAGLILLDPVFVPDRALLPIRLMTQRRRSNLPMVRGALRRPQRFDSLEDAFEFYRPKRAFAGMGDAALWDYVRASKVPHPDGGVQLRFPAAWEAAIYQSPPRVKPLLKCLQLPTLGLRGRDSNTLLPAVWRRWAHWQPTATLRECPGGHLFPLEQPRAAAALIGEFLAAQS